MYSYIAKGVRVRRKIIIPFVVTSSAWRVRTAILDLITSGLCCVNTTNLPHGIFWLVVSTSEILFTKLVENLMNLETFKINKFAKIYHQTCLLLVPAESNTIQMEKLITLWKSYKKSLLSHLIIGFGENVVNHHSPHWITTKKNMVITAQFGHASQ